MKIRISIAKPLMLVCLTLFLSCATKQPEKTESPEPPPSALEKPGAIHDREAVDDSEKKKEGAENPAENSLGAVSTLAEDKSDIAAGELESPEPEISSRSPSPMVAGSLPQASGLKAGFADDNKQFGYFINFLKNYSQVPHFSLDVTERIIFQVLDKNGESVPDAELAVYGQGALLCTGKTMADGSFLFFPAEYGSALSSYELEISALNQQQRVVVQRQGERKIAVKLQATRAIPNPIPLDVLFILDTTGSMGEEINRLRATIELIHLNLTSLSAKPRVRFGMVLYKDVGDEYVTRVVPLTADLAEFKKALALITADGGGDGPEDLQAALEKAIKNIDWNRNGIRLGFIITDAPPHLDYQEQSYTYVNACRDAKARGIKLFSVGTGGLNIDGEYVLRQIAQYTSGKYIFLTYGEAGESEGGSAGSVSHHTGENYQTDKLEAIIIRFAKEELSYLTGEPLEEEDSYFEANKIATEEREETLRKLFNMTLEQLLDYSSYAVKKDTRLGVLPLEAVSKDTGLDAEYYTEQLYLAAAQMKRFVLVERKDLQRIVEEQNLQLSGVTEDKGASEIGKILGAELLLTGKLLKVQDHYELFMKLLRVETAEVLSITKAVIDKNLSLGWNP